MQANKWLCQKHENQPVNFICIGNSWHFEPLCNLCVPDHTKNHPKTIKIQMQSLSNILIQSSSIKFNVIQIYTQKHKKCQQLSTTQEEDLTYIKLLKQKQTQLITKINIAFDKIIQTIKQRRSQQLKKQQQNLKKITKTLQDNINFLKQQSQTTSIVQFCREIKKFYFKDSLEMYVEQVDQIINQYRQKVINCNPIIWHKDMEVRFDKFVDDIYKIQEQKRDNKVDKVEKDDKVKKQGKKREVQKKRCPNCKEQMEYLTQWKKHLICRNCGGKERNYVKRS